MSKNKIVHIIVIDKFIPAFIEFVNQHFDEEDHLYIVLGKRDDRYGKLDAENILFINKKRKIITLLKYLYSAKKIIIHGLWNEIFIKILFVQPWLLKKSYWVMWGGDFYFPEKHSWYKKQVIKKMGYFITYLKGDYHLVQEWYGAKGEYCECFMYPSNLYKEYEVVETAHKTINIQVGNSADSTNNHFEVLQKLLKFKDEDINIFVPLSYGDENYAKEVIAKGKELFGDKFKPMVDFMPFDKYLKFLGSIDIAIFAHKRQQAMGNTITLLGLGKKVYMRDDVTPWKFFEDKGVKNFNLESIDLKLITIDDKLSNQNKIANYFSKENYIYQLNNLFYGVAND
jgi:hypothetical protein